MKHKIISIKSRKYSKNLKSNILVFKEISFLIQNILRFANFYKISFLNTNNMLYLRLKCRFCRNKFCKFHVLKNFHCFRMNSYKRTLKILKLLISRKLCILSKKIKILFYVNRFFRYTSYIQSVRIKEFFNFTKKSFRKIINISLNNILKSGPKSCLIIFSGVHKSKRTRTVKFLKGSFIHSGSLNSQFYDIYKCNVKKRRGMLGIKIFLMKSLKQIKYKHKLFNIPGKVSFLKKDILL